MVAPAIIAGIIVIIWAYSNARLQYLLLYGYGELIDKVSDLEARSQGGKKGGRKPQRPAESHMEPNAEPEPEPDCSDEGQPKTKRRPDRRDSACSAPFGVKNPENPAIFRKKTLALGVFLW